MRARITSASHVWPDEKTGLLRVRVDFFPDPGDPLYDGCHVQVPERPFTPDELNLIDQGSTEQEQHAIYEQVLAAIPKVWQVNPINCHMFLLPLGFTHDDLLVAVAERIPQLKAIMSEAKKQGFKELRGLPNQMCYATCPEKGEGKALIPTAEKEWIPTLVEQAGTVLNNLEIKEAEPVKLKGN